MAGDRKETVATDFFEKAEGYKDDTALDFRTRALLSHSSHAPFIR